MLKGNCPVISLHTLVSVPASNKFPNPLWETLMHVCCSHTIHYSFSKFDLKMLILRDQIGNRTKRFSYNELGTIYREQHHRHSSTKKL